MPTKFTNPMNTSKYFELTAGYARTIKIVNHHSKFLNGKTGTIVGKEFPSFYNWKVWLPSEQITVIVSQANIVPVTSNAISFADVFTVHWILFHNIAITLQAWLRK